MPDFTRGPRGAIKTAGGGAGRTVPFSPEKRSGPVRPRAALLPNSSTLQDHIDWRLSYAPYAEILTTYPAPPVRRPKCGVLQVVDYINLPLLPLTILIN